METDREIIKAGLSDAARENRANFIAFLVQQLDPRNYVETRAFFEQLRPEVADAIGAFYNRFHRIALDATLKIRDINNGIKKHVREPLNGGEWEQWETYASEFVTALYPRAFHGYEAIETQAEALHAFSDDGWGIALDNALLNVSQRLLTDEGFNEEMNNYVGFLCAPTS